MRNPIQRVCSFLVAQRLQEQRLSCCCRNRMVQQQLARGGHEGPLCWPAQAVASTDEAAAAVDH